MRVRVAIVDSGVHATHPHVQGVAGGVGISESGQVHEDFVDRLGHGTAVAAVIREKAPDADLFAVKIFDRQLVSTGAALVAALAWARREGVQVVNLSLGTTNVEHEQALAVEVRAALERQIVIVAAGPDATHRWMPGCLPGVVRATIDMAIPRDECRASVTADGGISIAASGYPRPVPGVPVEKNFKGLSFAVANVTGLVARAWPEWRSALLLPSDKSL